MKQKSTNCANVSKSSRSGSAQEPLTNVFQYPEHIERAGNEAVKKAIGESHELGLSVTHVNGRGEIVRKRPDGSKKVIGKVARTRQSSELKKGKKFSVPG